MNILIFLLAYLSGALTVVTLGVEYVAGLINNVEMAVSNVASLFGM